ncbi:glycosyl transferase family 2 [Amnibacterium kyonggiense]|uniref:Glycosyl transferase family 2 n=2 Tax=Amnibacterium kyonggiense TaxID=595671 RepID=A0A4R7FIW9_9MICO|nr:glycosyl transferase family 2 [Amnibacterium kyonggiense]
MRATCNVVVVILTKDESVHIARAIGSVRQIRLDIDVVVVDSGSTDGTVEIAKGLGARVLHRQFDSHARQFNWALSELASAEADWIMRLDADEVISTSLADEISRELPHLPEDVSAIYLNRRHIFWRTWIRHGGRWPLWLCRVWRPGSAHVEDRLMDEHVIVDVGRSIRFEGSFDDVNLKPFSDFVRKHNSYSDREAVDALSVWLGSRTIARNESEKLGRQARVKRLLKLHLYQRLPLFTGPFVYYTLRMCAQGGILDGRAGVVYHFMQGLWYRLLVDVKSRELRTLIKDLANREHIVQVVADYSNLDAALVAEILFPAARA